MNRKLFLILFSLLSFAIILASTAEAKRFGGGMSFGGKKSYSSPFKQKSTQQKSFSQQKAAATNQQRKQQLASRGGLMGMLGGLALGGLLGALFFGGAFEGFNFFDFFIIGAVILAIMWFMKRKNPVPQPESATANGFNMDMSPPENERMQPDKSSSTLSRVNSEPSDARFSEELGSQSSQESSNNTSKQDVSFAESFGMNQGQSDETMTSSDTVTLPDWFDQNEFLSGARSAYTMLQEAWDQGDLETIRGLTTDTVYNEIAQQFAQAPSRGATRIAQLNSELVDFSELADQTEAAVLFDALLSESDDNGQQGRTSQVRELWHFVRARNSTEPTWYLDGIQQLE